MDNINARVILTSYHQIPRLVKSLDKCVNYSVKSGFGCVHYRQGLNTFDLFNNIIEYIDRKEKLIFIYNETRELLNKLSVRSATILRLKFLENKKVEEIANVIDYSVRSTYRLYLKALDEFANKLKQIGVDDEWIAEEWFLSRVKIILLEELDTTNIKAK